MNTGFVQGLAACLVILISHHAFLSTTLTSRFVSLGLEAVFHIVHSPLHLALLYVHEHLQWDSKSGLAGMVSGHTGLIIPPDVIFMFGSCTGGRMVIFLSVCYSSLLARRAESGENVVLPAKANPQKLDECPTAVAQGINSQFIEIPLILEHGLLLTTGPVFRLITLSSRTRD